MSIVDGGDYRLLAWSIPDLIYQHLHSETGVVARMYWYECS